MMMAEPLHRAGVSGALTGIVPAPSMIFLVRPLPLRTTSA